MLLPTELSRTSTIHDKINLLEPSFVTLEPTGTMEACIHKLLKDNEWKASAARQVT